MNNFIQIDSSNNGNYIKLLTAVAQLSGLFSESATPFIHYRVAENIFCRSFCADNLSRTDTAFDAKYQSCGVGLKTFTYHGSSSIEKIAEFNTHAQDLLKIKDQALARKLAEYRNERIALAKRMYGISKTQYHIVARRNNELKIFETDYDLIDIDHIAGVKNNGKSLEFHDGEHLYRFNYSKSTLFRRFEIPRDAHAVKVDIIDNPYDLLFELFNKKLQASGNRLKEGIDFVILPLYGIAKGQKCVFERSGLNQWNARGRMRDMGEVYIPVPKKIHNLYPQFFPSQDELFNLTVPTGEVFQAKLCQQGAKALMTNPNKALSDWLLRKLLKLEDGQLATYEMLNKLGFDSVIITKDDPDHFRIDKAKINSYEKFINKSNMLDE